MAEGRASFRGRVDVPKLRHRATVPCRRSPAPPFPTARRESRRSTTGLAHLPSYVFRSWLDAVGTAVGIQQKMMRHADVTTTMNVYGKGMMDSKLEAHTKLLEYARVGSSGVAAEPTLEPSC